MLTSSFARSLRRTLHLCSTPLLVATLGWTTLAAAGPAEDTKEATRLYQQGKLDQALTKINAALAQQPKDAQGRFIKGLILTEQKKPADAIQVFTSLTEDYPELPEPYNNLAVLYASQGNYDKAKAALELAIHTHPSYATAYENLGDIYAQLARRSYDKVLQLDKTNTTAQSKLAMVKDLFSPPKNTAVATAEPAKVAAASTVPAKTEPAKTAAPPVKVEPTKSEPVKTAPAKPSGNADEQVRATVLAWAQAWAGKDVPGYLSYYAADFTPPDGLTRAAWEAQRKDRIERPKSISVEVKISKVTIKGDEATAVFRQAYRSDTTKSNNTKTLKLIRSGDKWLIRTERAGA